jgi:hypothetical protein
MIQHLKESGREKEIQKYIKLFHSLNQEYVERNKDVAFLE